MSESIIHAIVLVQSWGDDRDLVRELQQNTHAISVYHVMGRHSYLVDVNFDNKEQLSGWITRMKSITLAGGVPAILSLRTQKIIQVNKQKETYSLLDYREAKGMQHFFMEIDNPHHDEELLKLLQKSDLVQSILHVQGESSYTIEVLVRDYEAYKKLLTGMKGLTTVHHIETFEVISVLKYRSHLMDATGNLVKPVADIRELYTL